MDILFEKTKTGILAYCVEDWTSLYFISSFVRQYYHYNDQELIKMKSFTIIKKLLDENLIKAGDLTNDNKFVLWNMSPEEVLNKIKYEWDNLGRELYMYEIVWFDITEKGEKEFEYLNSLPELKETDPFYFDEE